MRTDAFKWAVVVLVAGIAGGAVYFQYQQTRPCVEPVAYSVGALDPRFNISESAVIQGAAASAAIWNKAAGKAVLVYDKNAAMKINFIYDEREENAKLGAEIAREQASQDNARAHIDTLQAEFAADQAAYNRDVQQINARGGATPSEAAALNSRQQSLSVLADLINAEVAAYNASIANVNAKVKQFNQSAGHTFRQGEYVQDSRGKRINIFEFIGAVQLERVLAHEFGHAIGLEHNEDPKSIMFAKNESGNLAPTSADLAALKALCRLN